MSTATYQILDEPRSSRLSHLAVQPLWPLLAVMLGGTWAAWPWFAINAYAVGSPTRVRELVWACGGFVGTLALVVGLISLDVSNTVSDTTIRYLYVFLLVWKLTVSYWLYILQSRTFALYSYFGGVVRTGLFVLLLAFFLRSPLLNSVPTFFALILK